TTWSRVVSSQADHDHGNVDCHRTRRNPPGVFAAHRAVSFPAHGGAFGPCRRRTAPGRIAGPRPPPFLTVAGSSFVPRAGSAGAGRSEERRVGKGGRAGGARWGE